MKLPTLLLILTTLLPVAAEAAPGYGNELIHRDRNGQFDRDLLGSPQRKEATSLDEAVKQVRKESGGRVLAAETITIRGERIHRIKVLTPEKRVRIIRVDAGR